MPILMSNSSHRSCKMEALVGSCWPICSYLLQSTWTPGTAESLKRDIEGQGSLQPRRKPHTVQVEGSFVGSLCRELLSCVRALLANLWNIKGNVVVKTWRVWVGQQLLSTRSPSANLTCYELLSSWILKNRTPFWFSEQGCSLAV